MGSMELKAMQWPFTNPKYIFFTDFDGTITLKDSNDFMVLVLSTILAETRLTDMPDRQYRLWRRETAAGQS